MTARFEARVRKGFKKVLPDRAIRVLAAARRSLQTEKWVETAERLGDPTLRRLAYWPAGTQNPYLRLLYSRIPEVGFAASPLVRFGDLDTLDTECVFHLHWTRGAQLGAGSREEAEAMAADYLAPIESFVGRGGMLIWSVHEEAPHDVAHPEVESAMRTRLADLAAGVHVLHASTGDSVAHLYHLPPEKTFVVEHPLYSGYYPRYVRREAARRLLGVGRETALIVGFGAIRPYKGFERLVRLSHEVRAATQKPVDMIVAGPTMQHSDLGSLEDAVAETSGVTLSAGPVPDQDVQLLFEAADVIALPYRRVMNSGVLMLGLTFERVCVAPRNAIAEDAAASGLVELFEAESDESLREALVRAVTNPRPGHELPQEFRNRYDPFFVAGEFAGHLANVTAHRS